MNKENKKTEYREVQRFREWDVLFLLSLFGVGLAYRAFAGYMGWWGAPSTSSLPTYLLLTMVVGIILLYYSSLRLFLGVSKKGVKYQFYPWHFHKHKIDWSEVENYQVVNIPLHAALTGWSVDFSDEQCFSVTGRRKGLALDLKNGKRVFISTKKPERLHEVIKEIQKHNKQL